MLFRSLGRASRKPLRVQLQVLSRNGRSVTPVDVNVNQQQPQHKAPSLATIAVSLAAVGTFAAAFSTTTAHSEGAKTTVLEDKYPLPDYLRTAEDFLYPAIQPFNAGKLQVSKTHSLYYEECGNPYGKPVIMVHGGPGAGCSDGMRRYHDPRVYRIILVDQRGSGRSTPHACLEENTYVISEFIYVYRYCV